MQKAISAVMIPLLVVLIGTTGFLTTFWMVIIQYNVLEQSAISPTSINHINLEAGAQGYYR